MKHSVFRKASYLFLLLSSLLFSCKDSSQSVEMLTQAQKLIESNPDTALTLLNSIHNPENMDKDNYMKYIVIHTQAKLKKEEDGINETLIFEAQKYFKQKNDIKTLALVHFIIGHLYEKKQMYDEALRCFLQAEDYARQTNDNILAGKSIHNIGYLYFERKLMDSAIVRYRQAINYYNREQNTDQLKGQAMNLIGNTYDVIGKLDSAYSYYNRSLEIAKRTNDKPYQAIATSNLGVVFREMEEYNKAVGYFHKSLGQTSDSNDSLRIYLNLSKLYNKKNQLDSAKYYIELMENRLAEIKNNYTLSSAYGSLYTYNKQSGDEQKAEYYSKLQEEIRNKIAEVNRSQKLLEIEKKYQVSLSLREKEIECLQIRSYLYMSIGISAAILIVLITWFRNKRNRLNHAQEVEKNKLLEQKLENLLFIQSIYHNIITEWTSIEDEAKSLAVEFNAADDPSIYGRIRQMVENVKGKTNRQLIENAKDYLKKESFGKQAIEILNDKELLIIMLSYCRYSKKEMAIILGNMAGSKNLHVQKLDIQRKLLEAGMSEEITNEILFSKNGNKNPLST